MESKIEMMEPRKDHHCEKGRSPDAAIQNTIASSLRSSQ